MGVAIEKREKKEKNPIISYFVELTRCLVYLDMDDFSIVIRGSGI